MLMLADSTFHVTKSRFQTMLGLRNCWTISVIAPASLKSSTFLIIEGRKGGIITPVINNLQV